MPYDQYERFVRISESKKNLDEIRKGLSSEEIIDAKLVEEKKPKIVAFPDTDKKFEKYKTLHEAFTDILNSKLGLTAIDTVAGQEMLKERQDLLLRMLWILALYGEKDGDALSVDAISISEHKKGTSGFPTHVDVWLRWLGLLTKVGLPGELVFVTEDHSQLFTPTGWLRDRLPGTNNPVYHVKLSFNEKLGGPKSLTLLQSYARALADEYDKRAYSRFKKADMRFLQEKE